MVVAYGAIVGKIVRCMREREQLVATFKKGDSNEDEVEEEEGRGVSKAEGDDKQGLDSISSR